MNGKNCPFQHANDPVTKKPLPPSPEDVKRYQAALKRNPSLADLKPSSSSGTNKPSSSVPTIKMIRVVTPEESEEEPEPEQPTSIRLRPPGNHPNPEGPIDWDELAQRFSRPGNTDLVCWHMRSRTLFADIIPGGNQHGRWLYCRQCGASGAVQTLDLMSCVNCSLTHIYHPTNDLRKTCVWTKWLRMIARYRFRMSDPEKAQLRERILRCQERRRLRAAVVQPAREQTQVLPQGPMRVIVHGEDDWEEAIRQERLSLLAHHATAVMPSEGGATSSGSTHPVLEERCVHVEHASFASSSIVTTRRSDGQVLQRNLRTGRTRLLAPGGFIPDTGGDPEPGEPENDHQVAAVSVGAVKTTGSEDHYCMLDSGANVMVIPWKEGLEGDHTMCALVGDNKTEGLVVARLATRQRTHLIVAVKGARPLIPTLI